MTTDRTQRLQSFLDWTAAHITGDEKSEAHTFIDHLFKAFGQLGSLDVGGKPEYRIKTGKGDDRGTSFADYVWKPIVLIEMKKRGTDLSRHLKQATDYWWNLAPNRPQYTILCNFDEFQIYDFNIDIDEPLDTVSIAQLPTRYEPLAFLFPTQERPVFKNNRVEVTRAAADRLATAFFHMAHTRKVERNLAQRFILQMLVALFAEDMELLPKNFVTTLLAEIKTPEDSYDLLGGLFEAMNRPGGTPSGRFKGVQYFNGGIFREPARLALDPAELNHIREAARENWSKVSPDIFGTLFQHSMDEGQRHAFGAHYTAPIDIMKIVRPTIVEPWTKLIDHAKNPETLNDLAYRLSHFTVLDPACGSGNFLYLAYRELKRLEARIRIRLRTEFPGSQNPLSVVTARQFYGMDILPFAIELAKVTMMLARKLAIDELHISDEPPLPLDNLDKNFQCTDALVTNAAPDAPADSPNAGLAIKTPWPLADVIIGNPPFLGAKRLKPEHGPDYTNTLRKLYPNVPGMADYCVYWFRRAHDQLPPCTPAKPESGRAGLVGTQNIRNNQSRVGGLDHIVQSGTIIEAVENQPWSGEANVHVSIANWVKTALHIAPGLPGLTARNSNAAQSPTKPPIPNAPSQSPATIDPKKLLIPPQKKLWHKIDPKLAPLTPSKTRAPAVTTPGKHGKILASKSYELDFRETSTINSALSDAVDITTAGPLKCNIEPRRIFRGLEPGNMNFLLTEQQGRALIDQDPKSAQVIRPYLTGQELLTGDGTPERWLIDFQRMDQLAAREFSAAFKHVERAVIPEMKRIAAHEEKKIGQPKDEFDTRIKNRQLRSRLATWWQLRRCVPETVEAVEAIPRYIVCSLVTKRPIFVFVSNRMRPSNLLQSFNFPDDYSFGILQSAAHWLWFTTKCSKLTERFRYTPESVFDTFPWPQSPTKKQIDSVAAAGREIRRIRTEALQKIKGGLRPLYRTLELPGKNPLKDAHSALDAAVLAAYNFNPTQDLLTQLLSLNLQVAANIEQQKPVTSPGIPATYNNPAPLVTDDCISL